MRNIFCVLLTSLLLPSISFSQSNRVDKQEKKREKINNMIRQEEEGVIAYPKSFAFGGKLATDGYGVFFEMGRASSVKKSLLFQLEISERKDKREEKLGARYPYSSPYIYGKMNYVYPVKLGVQQQLLLGNKSNKNGVSVTGNIGGGVAAALLRPYYMQVIGLNGLEFIKYSAENRYDFLHNAVGGPTIGKGWSDMKVTPGLYVKAATRFDYGRFNEMISAIETGISLEYYTKGIPQLVDAKQKQLFFGSYVALMFGRRK